MVGKCEYELTLVYNPIDVAVRAASKSWWCFRCQHWHFEMLEDNTTQSEHVFGVVYKPTMIDGRTMPYDPGRYVMSAAWSTMRTNLVECTLSGPLTPPTYNYMRGMLLVGLTTG